jgi:hypothetical protein
MSASEVSYWDSIKRVVGSFVSEYKDTTVSYSAITAATLLFWASGAVGDTPAQTGLRVLSVGVVLGSLVYTFVTGRPFGIQLDWTPAHIVDGKGTSDKESESRGNALIQNSDLLIHGEVRFSKFDSDFQLLFETSSEITAELENRPRAEHNYDPEENILSCRNISDRTFPIKLRVYPERPVEQAGRYHDLSFVDGKSGSTISQVEVIDVRN